jgi:tetratricopeptide (TPR) repeat protein
MRDVFRAAALVAIVVVAGTDAVRGAPSRPSADRISAWTADLDAAAVWLGQGRVEDARQAFERVLAEMPSAGGPPLLRARAWDGLGDVQSAAGATEAAIESYRRALVLWDATLGPAQPRIAVTLHNLAAVLLAAGRCDEAREAVDRALGIWSAARAASAEAENTRRLGARACGVAVPTDR